MTGDLGGLSGRQHERQGYQSWLDIAILDDAGVCVQAIRSPSADISDGGCGIMTAEEYPPGTKVLMRFQSPGHRNASVTRWCVVRHSRRVSRNGWCMVGFQFEDRSEIPSPAFSWTEGQSALASEAA